MREQLTEVLKVVFVPRWRKEEDHPCRARSRVGECMRASRRHEHGTPRAASDHFSARVRFPRTPVVHRPDTGLECQEVEFPLEDVEQLLARGVQVSPYIESWSDRGFKYRPNTGAVGSYLESHARGSNLVARTWRQHDSVGQSAFTSVLDATGRLSSKLTLSARNSACVTSRIRLLNKTGPLPAGFKSPRLRMKWSLRRSSTVTEPLTTRSHRQLLESRLPSPSARGTVLLSARSAVISGTSSGPANSWT